LIAPFITPVEGSARGEAIFLYICTFVLKHSYLTSNTRGDVLNIECEKVCELLSAARSKNYQARLVIVLLASFPVVHSNNIK
jgi:hypothetical protein